ncbi:unnamed protein product [Linum trigynum]|uniref:Uncharacterized protein n=1 Tax=Linum trigynum TaxID=586398 RepID=A0AAV2E7V1_9ROSI
MSTGTPTPFTLDTPGHSKNDQQNPQVLCHCGLRVKVKLEVDDRGEHLNCVFPAEKEQVGICSNEYLQPLAVDDQTEGEDFEDSTSQWSQCSESEDDNTEEGFNIDWHGP